MQSLTMEDKMRNDLYIAGDLTLPGGTFKDVVIRGKLETKEDLDCNEYIAILAEYKHGINDYTIKTEISNITIGY
ncbi:hypothetical protein GI584_01805 [Gracilibacillus salitolerans]|uniref:Uncharacterized protein n=2 Tax=Gracilibacillus salitolerans TaxID=2663022 RepID=A0A5Q2TFD9_9BACI|nr:hypothetical protein GI584_01805 [Gracilibacillus salitolerans]